MSTQFETTGFLAIDDRQPSYSVESISIANEEVSKDIRYKIQYRNDAGDTIKEEENYKPWPKIVTVDEKEHTGSVLDIVNYVTIREISFGTSVKNKRGARAAGTDREPMRSIENATPTKSEDTKNQNLEITSVGRTGM